MRFTYKTEENNAVIYTTIEETAGVFIGYTAEQVAKVAETLQPNYQSHNLSSTFMDIYFNYCVRKVLQGESIPNTYIPRSTETD